MKLDKRAFVFVDVVGSLALKTTQYMTEARAHEIIALRLARIEDSLIAVDSGIRRTGPSEGDSILLIGENLAELFKVCVRAQNDWKGWVDGPSVRICIGWGYYEEMTDSAGVNLRGKDIDLTCKLKLVTPQGGVCVTEAAVQQLPPEWLSKLILRTEIIQGCGPDPIVFREANHYWVPPAGELQPAGDRQSTTTVIERRRKGPTPDDSFIAPSDIFWKVFAVAFVVICVMMFVYVVRR